MMRLKSRNSGSNRAKRSFTKRTVKGSPSTASGGGKRLWDKGEPSDALMQQLTVGNDPELDRALVTHDCVGSAAHARMLCRARLISRDELRKLLRGLRSIHALGRRGEFEIPYELEDVHTAIESWLTKRFGEAAQRIHTARSRNDQVLLAMRLYVRQQVLDTLNRVLELLVVLERRFRAVGDTPLPGYTHMQPAMPSSFGMWLHAWYEELLAWSQRGVSLITALDRSPLGGAAGFGVPFAIDPEYTALLLGFSGAFRSPIHANNSRGRDELLALNWLAEFGGVHEKFLIDVMLYCSREFGVMSLPNKLTTGSSIMPQKRNPDIVELGRARCARLRGYQSELAWLVAKLPTSYHRDLQLTKEPVMRAFKDVSELCDMLELVLRGFSVNEDRCRALMHADLYATYDAYREVLTGVPFREAYRATAKRVTEGTLELRDLAKDFMPIAKRTRKGMQAAVREGKQLGRLIAKKRAAVEKAERAIFL